MDQEAEQALKEVEEIAELEEDFLLKDRLVKAAAVLRRALTQAQVPT